MATILEQMEGVQIEFWLKRPSDANKSDKKLRMSHTSTLADVKGQVQKVYDDQPQAAYITVGIWRVKEAILLTEQSMNRTRLQCTKAITQDARKCMRFAVDPRRTGAEG